MKRITLVVLTVLLAVVGLSACGNENPGVITRNNNAINSDVNRLQQTERLPRLLDSADLRIQNYNYTAEADPNKIWYLEILSFTGTVEGSYTIRGPVVPLSDQVTNPYQEVCRGEHGEGCAAVGLAEPNGIYQGASNDHIAILTTGAILKWEGPYQTSDQPFIVRTPATVSINENAPVTSTDLSKTQGGLRPTQK